MTKYAKPKYYKMYHEGKPDDFDYIRITGKDIDVFHRDHWNRVARQTYGFIDPLKRLHYLYELPPLKLIIKPINEIEVATAIFQ